MKSQAHNVRPRSPFAPTWSCLTVLLAAAVLSVAVAVAADGGDHLDDYLREIEDWRQDRLERLQRPDGWLTLAGLFWLHEGANSCGSDEGADVRLPASVPARVGTFHLAGGKAAFTPLDGVEVHWQGAPLDGRMELATDMDGAPTLLEMGPIQFHVIRRQDRLGVRVKDAQSPIRLEFKGIDHYPVDASWRIAGRFEPHDPPKTIPIPNAQGHVVDEPSPGVVIFEIGGATYRLDVLEGAEEDELFLVFGDQTNGKETYGGGRFLYADLAADRRVTLDFNKSYNPPCAFTPYATCPLPPRENRLATAIHAGEKKYGEGHP